MLPFVVGGIVVAATVIGAICDTLSDAEAEKRERLRQKSEADKAALAEERERLEAEDRRLREEFEEEKAALRMEKRQLRQERAERKAQARREAQAARRAAIEEAKAEQRRICIGMAEEYRQAALEAKENRDKALADVQGTKKQCIEALENQKSLMRKNALENLVRDLDMAIWRMKQYCTLLNKYINNYIPNYIDKTFAYRGISPRYPDDFPERLPDDCFYRGKLVYIAKNEIASHGSMQVPVFGTQKYRFEEFDFIKDFPDSSSIPLVCDYFSLAPDYEWVLSAKKGHFKDVVENTPRMGLEALVKRSTPKKAILNFANSVEMELGRSNFLNPMRVPPKGAQLKVYPVWWDYLLQKTVRVSERILDSYLAYSFEEIPFVITESQWRHLYGIIEANKLVSAQGEWKIAPFDEGKLPELAELKLQLAERICIKVNACQFGDKLCLEYRELLDETHFIKADDVFFAMDATLSASLSSELANLDGGIFENMAELYLKAASEFRIQKDIKESRKGIGYFNRWSEATDKLIAHLEKGNPFTLQIKQDADRRESRKAEVANHGEFAAYLRRMGDSERQPVFMSEPCEGMPCQVFPASDGKSVEIDMEDGFEIPGELEIWTKEFPSAEIRQAEALRQFRDGRLANPELQPYALDSSRIAPQNTGIAVSSFRNADIQNDASQKDAVLRALSEKSIFLIQGPPGTGKTTVIREIIEQVLATDPDASILVASQANVAVDNVLKHFAGRRRLIRFGQDGKIAPELSEHGFASHYDRYMRRISEKSESMPDDDLLSYWRETLEDGRGARELVGSLLASEYPLVGATCVGLSGRGIGLDKRVFDLVIMDEAGKALPGEFLIPYNRARKVVIIGDHRQLPPTVHPWLLSDSADDSAISDPAEQEQEEEGCDDLFNSSVFQRMYEGCPASNKSMLNVQYRMAPVIGTMISELFYGGKLENGHSTSGRRPVYVRQGWDPAKSSIVFLHHRVRESYVRKNSLINEGEIGHVRDLLKELEEKVDSPLEIAVITPYKGQLRELRKMRDALKTKHDIKVNTVDAFQGDEADIAIFCTTRTDRKTPFFSDSRRLNVALSRARNQLFIVGSLRYFMDYGEGSTLGKIAGYAARHGQLVNLGSAEEQEWLDAVAQRSAHDGKRTDKRGASPPQAGEASWKFWKKWF